MNNRPLPDNDHISRYCASHRTWAQNGMLLPAAFLPRKGERYLSVNWLEYFDKADLGDAIEEVREVFRRKGYKVKSNGRFAVLEIGAAKAAGDTLSIKHLPSINDESHAGILGILQVPPLQHLQCCWSKRYIPLYKKSPKSRAGSRQWPHRVTGLIPLGADRQPNSYAERSRTTLRDSEQSSGTLQALAYAFSALTE